LERIRSASAAASRREFVIGLWIPDADHNTAPGGFSSLNYLAAGTAGSGLPLTEGQVQVQHGPQGLDASESGLRGCQLVDVDSSGSITSRLIPTAPVRWETCLANGRGVRDCDELCERMLSSLDSLSRYAGEEVRIISWPLEQAVLEAAGLSTERDLHDLAESLQELTDQPKHGLRYLHVIRPVWVETSFPAAVDRELWQDFLSEMERNHPLERDRLQRLWEQQTGSAAAPNGWPAELTWPPVNSEHVRRRTLLNGRRWFQPTAGGAAR
jgi:hypothetical protein